MAREPDDGDLLEQAGKVDELAEAAAKSGRRTQTSGTATGGTPPASETAKSRFLHGFVRVKDKKL